MSRDAGSDTSAPMIRARSHPPASEELLQRLTAMIAPARIPGARVLGAATQSFALARGSSTFLAAGCDCVLFLITGAAKLVAHVPPDREQILSFHFPGDMVFLPHGGTHSLALTAISDCEVLGFETADLFSLATADAQLAMLLCQRAIGALGRCRDKAIALGRKTAPERVADFLLSMAPRIGVKDARAEMTLLLPMSRRDIADSLGLTIETVSRQFGAMRTAGVIETSGRSEVRILDWTDLQARAGKSFAADQFISQI